jgi:hypothetical protein
MCGGRYMPGRLYADVEPLSRRVLKVCCAYAGPLIPEPPMCRAAYALRRLCTVLSRLRTEPLMY